MLSTLIRSPCTAALSPPRWGAPRRGRCSKQQQRPGERLGLDCRNGKGRALQVSTAAGSVAPANNGAISATEFAWIAAPEGIAAGLQKLWACLGKGLLGSGQDRHLQNKCQTMSIPDSGRTQCVPGRQEAGVGVDQLHKAAGVALTEPSAQGRDGAVRRGGVDGVAPTRQGNVDVNHALCRGAGTRKRHVGHGQEIRDTKKEQATQYYAQRRSRKKRRAMR